MVNEEEIKSSPVFGSYSLLQYAQQSASNFLPMPFLEFEKPTQPKSSFAITNIVSVVNLNCYIDLSSAVRLCRNWEYNPKRFSGMIMKIKTPKATAIVFSNGKLVCLGTKSVEESKTAAKKFAKTIKQLGYEVRFTGFRVVNIISSASCGHVVSLERMSLKSKLDCDYEPEIFPGLIYRMNNPKVTIVIFLSGKFNILGARTWEDAVKAYYSIIPQLRNFEKIA